jgi:hypothetical protein
MSLCVVEKFEKYDKEIPNESEKFRLQGIEPIGFKREEIGMPISSRCCKSAGV